MRKSAILAAISSASLLSMSGAAFAQEINNYEGVYFDVGYSFINIDVDVDDVSGEINLGAVTGHAGYNFSDNFAVEVEASLGVDDEDASDGMVSASVGLETALGVYAKGEIPLNDQFRIFGRIGFISAELEAEATGIGSVSDSDTGVAYGVGGTADINENVFVRVDYTAYDIDAVDADVVFIGIGARL